MEAVTELQLSPRVSLKPGDSFRTVRGTGPHFGESKTPLGPFETFTLLSFIQKRTRLYGEARSESGTHVLYLKGPKYKSPGGSTYEPFKIKKVSA